jgi:hypothetical protein
MRRIVLMQALAPLTVCAPPATANHGADHHPGDHNPIQPWRWNNCVPSNDPSAPPMK